MKWLLYKLVELNISWNVITTWLTRFQRNAFYGPEINGDPIVYIGDLTFERCGASRHQNTRELPFEQKLNLRQVDDPIKNIPTCSSTDIYRICRTQRLRWKGQRATEIQPLNTPHDRRCCRQAMTPRWCSSIDTLCFPQKNWRVHFRHQGWGREWYLPPRLRGDMATPTTIALDSSFNLLLISRILVDRNGNCLHHVIIGINHGMVCVVDINSLVGCLAAGRSLGLRPRDRDSPLGCWCQEHTPVHD